VAPAAEAIGKTYRPTVYAVGREKVREYAAAVGETNPLYLDVDAAREAPPMFAVVYAGPSVMQGIVDPELGIDFGHLVHGSQEFRWGPLVVAGDEIVTTTGVKDISARGELNFYVFESRSRNQRGEAVCTGIWMNIVRTAQ